MGKLYATTVTSARPREREYKLTDGAGLYLLVKPNGRKLWRLNYAYLGKQRTLSFGAWPDVGLGDARERRDEARKMIAAGLDPSHEAKLATAREMLSEENSFKLVAEEWVAKQEREGMAEITLSKIRWLLDKAYPRIGNRPIAKITAQEVLVVLRSVEATGRYESARRMRSVLGRVFRYAIATTRAETERLRQMPDGLFPDEQMKLLSGQAVRVRGMGMGMGMGMGTLCIGVHGVEQFCFMPCSLTSFYDRKWRPDCLPSTLTHVSAFSRQHFDVKGWRQSRTRRGTVCQKNIYALLTSHADRQHHGRQ